jgi:GGDEF domain-containing protein
VIASAHSSERVLLIGDTDRQIYNAIAQVAPSAHVVNIATYFDAIVELSSADYTTVVASAEPIERRPEAAVQALRELAPQGRIVLFGHPTLEPLSRKMLEFGCDDYIVTPANSTELQQMFGRPPMRLAQSETTAEESDSQPTSHLHLLTNLPLAEIMLDAQLIHPQNPPGAAMQSINARIGPTMKLACVHPNRQKPDVLEGAIELTHAVRVEHDACPVLHLWIPPHEDETTARHSLTRMAQVFSKLIQLQERHTGLLKLAFRDELTGVHNGRFFKQFLSRITQKARDERFPVTLLLFDIDNFKQYNDRYGHGVGDEILRQTARLMRRSCREHDLVARISGDEFAVVFWEKEGPRQPYEPRPATAARLPATPRTVFERCRKLLASQDFAALGATGQGTLTISGGLAVFPYEAGTPEQLIELADSRLMFGAKKAGKDSLFLVGDESSSSVPPPT